MKELLVKFGTESLLDREGRLDGAIFLEIARQIVSLMDEGWSVAIVTSGAIRAGIEEAESVGVSFSGLHKKDYAALGSYRLMRMWSAAFRTHGRCVGQILITHANLQDSCEKKSIRESMTNLMAAGIIPVLNENDVVSDREIQTMDAKIGENDRLTALISLIINPDIVLSITSIGGVYDEYPITDRSRMYQELDIDNLPAGIIQPNIKSENGSGGMSKKIVALSGCCGDNRIVGIAGWVDDGVICFVMGEVVGTILGHQNRF